MLEDEVEDYVDSIILQDDGEWFSMLFKPAVEGVMVISKHKVVDSVGRFRFLVSCLSTPVVPNIFDQVGWTAALICDGPAGGGCSLLHFLF